jgi:ubiquinol-cytochrome c reductase cytochrome b subunit
MPIVGRWQLGHRFNVVWTFALLIGAGILTAVALRDDWNGETEHSQHSWPRSPRPIGRRIAPWNSPARPLEFAHRRTRRCCVPTARARPEAVSPALCRMPQTRPPSSATSDEPHAIVAEKPSAPNFGLRYAAMGRGLLDPKQSRGPNYFGNTTHKTAIMVTWVHDVLGEEADGRSRRGERAQLKDNVSLSLRTRG